MFREAYVLYEYICSSIRQTRNQSGFGNQQRESGADSEKKQKLKISRFPNLMWYRSTRTSYHVHHLFGAIGGRLKGGTKTIKIV